MPDDSASSDTTSSSQSFSETTRTSWLSRIGQSISGILIGLLLVVASAIVLVWNEGRAVQTSRSLTEGSGVVVDADPGRVDPANEGRLVHVTGDLRATSRLSDADFGVSAEALRLVRTVEMYQWKEESRTETHKNLGGSEETVTTYTYMQTWSDGRIDSSRFRHQDGHANPQVPYQRYEATAHDATLGAYHPGPEVVGKLPTASEFRLEPAAADALRSRIGSLQVVDGRYFIGADPVHPHVGDVRVGYRVAMPGTVSIIGRQAGPGFGDFQTKAGDRLLMAEYGSISAADMFKAAEEENRILTWVIRAAGVILMLIGWALIFRPLVVVADVVPLLGSLLGAGTGVVALLLTALEASIVIAIAWLWYRPLVSIVVLVVGGAIVFGVRRMASSRAAPRAATAA